MSKLNIKSENQIDATVRLSLNGRPVDIKMSVPTGPTTAARMLPIFRSVAETIIDATVKHVNEQGFEVSCKKGCGACCRQLVPISETEARSLKNLVDNMPDSRRSEVIERFRSARERVENAGLAEALSSDQKPTGQIFKELALEYFHLGIPCPFLVDESCSIHPQRPIVCREYLAVSPPENCERRNGEQIRSIRLPAHVSKAVSALGTEPNVGFDRWVPLTFSLELGEQQSEPEQPRPGTEIVKELFDRLLGFRSEEAV